MTTTAYPTATAHNTVRPLNFSGPHVRAHVVDDVKDFPVPDGTTVVNIGGRPAWVTAEPRTPLRPLTSTVLTGGRIERADRILLLRPDPDRAAAGITGEADWALLGDLLAGAPAPFPRDVPLWRGPQDDAGRVVLDPAALLGATSAPAGLREFRTLVNLWFAPAGTDCAIHRLHGFLEVHTQVSGTGRMQKFAAPRHDTLREDVVLAPGRTHEPFCAGAADGTFVYPWHQYRADTDCVWLAVEYHALTTTDRGEHR